MVNASNGAAAWGVGGGEERFRTRKRFAGSRPRRLSSRNCEGKSFGLRRHGQGCSHKKDQTSATLSTLCGGLLAARSTLKTVLRGAKSVPETTRPSNRQMPIGPYCTVREKHTGAGRGRRKSSSFKPDHRWRYTRSLAVVYRQPGGKWR